MRPLFIVGSGRSGTTVVAEAIAQLQGTFKLQKCEPKIFSDMNGCAGLSVALYRHRYSPKILRSRAEFYFRRREGNRDVGFFGCIKWKEFESIMTEYWDSVEQAGSDKTKIKEAMRWCYKRLWSQIDPDGNATYFIDDTPINALRIKEIIEVFPNAKILHIIRDGRQVALGHLRLGWCSSYQEGLFLWRSRVDAARLTARHLRLRAHQYREIEFGDLLRNPDSVMADVSAWLDLPYDKKCLKKAGFSTQKVNIYQVDEYEDDLFFALADDLAAEFKWQRSKNY